MFPPTADSTIPSVCFPLDFCLVLTLSPNFIPISDGAGLHGASVHCYKDHRIAMSFAVLGCVVPGIVITDKVYNTCPPFVADSSSAFAPSSIVSPPHSSIPRHQSSPHPTLRRSLPHPTLRFLVANRCPAPPFQECVEKTYPEFWEDAANLLGLQMDSPVADKAAAEKVPISPPRLLSTRSCLRTCLHHGPNQHHAPTFPNPSPPTGPPPRGAHWHARLRKNRCLFGYPYAISSVLC